MPESSDPNPASPDGTTRRVDRDAVDRWVDSLEDRVAGGAPRRFGPYELGCELGRGSMATVYLARHLSLRREVALKILPRSAAYDDASRQRFLLEARALARVTHPSVVRIYDVLEEDGAMAIAMERVDGRSLADVIARLRAASDDDRSVPGVDELESAVGAAPGAIQGAGYFAWAVQVGRDLADALDAVHAAGLTHRDIKPSNVLIDRRGRAHLADFGVVRDAETSLTRSGGFVGTARYASPEQLRGARDVGPGSDVYGLGATLYEIVCLEPAATGSPATILETAQRGAVPALTSRGVDLSRDLALIVHHALEPEPERRYETAAAMAADLRAFAEARPISVRPTRPQERLRLWIRREPARARWAGLALGAAVGLLGVGGWSLYQIPRIALVTELENRARFDALVEQAYGVMNRPRARARAPELFRLALAIQPDNTLAVGGLALSLTMLGRRDEARDELDSRRRLVAASPGLRYLSSVGVDLWQRPPHADIEIRESSVDALECFFAGIASRERARSLVHGGPGPALERRVAELMSGVVGLLEAAIDAAALVPNLYRIELARAAAAAGDRVRARRIVNTLHRSAPGSPWITLECVITMAEIGDVDRAAVIAQSPAFAELDTVDARLVRAGVLRLLGRFDEAIAELQPIQGAEAIEHVQQELAEIHADRGDEAAARRCRERALAALIARFARVEAAENSGGELSRLVIGIASLLDSLDRLDELESYARRTLTRVPDDWFSHAQLARIETLAGQQLDPRQPEGRRLQASHFAAARDHAVAASAAAPYHFYVAKAAVTTIAANLRDYPAALPYIQKLVEIVPDDVGNRTGQAIVLMELGRFDEAVDALEIICAAKPDDARSHAQLGFCLLFADRAKDARRALAGFTNPMDPQAMDLWDMRANATLAAIDARGSSDPVTIARARARIETIREQGRRTDPFLAAMEGEVMLAAGDREAAIACLERAERAGRTLVARSRGDAALRQSRATQVDRFLARLRQLLR